MLKIHTVTMIGANGNMGSRCGGLIAAFGNAKVFMVARSKMKANEGIVKAIDSVRSDVIKDKLIPLTYDDLSTCIPKSDWILEALTEDINIKHSLNTQISKFIKPKTIVSTTSSCLSINDLAADFNKNTQKYYFGTHFFNPPYKMLLCEVIPNPCSDKRTQEGLVKYLEDTLLRKVIVSKDIPAFVGNRIGFEVLNEALIYAQKYGIWYIDCLLGGITGRVMPPLKTIDLIGLDVYNAIVENIGLKGLPFVYKLVSAGKLGNKTGSGLYKFTRKNAYGLNIEKDKYKVLKKFNIELIDNVKTKMKEGRYKEAISMIMSSNTKEAKIIQYFFAKYIHASFSAIGSVVEKLQDIDKAMAYGFNWIPPFALTDLIGGKVNIIHLFNKFNFPMPSILTRYTNKDTFYTLQDVLDYRAFLRSI